MRLNYPNHNASYPMQRMNYPELIGSGYQRRRAIRLIKWGPMSSFFFFLASLRSGGRARVRSARAGGAGGGRGRAAAGRRGARKSEAKPASSAALSWRTHGERRPPRPPTFRHQPPSPPILSPPPRCRHPTLATRRRCRRLPLLPLAAPRAARGEKKRERRIDRGKKRRVWHGSHNF